MKKNVFLIFLICFVCTTFLLVFPSCKSPASPEENWPHSYEIMYERVLPIINPNETDVDKARASLVNSGGSGQNSSNFTKIGENKWTARFSNIYDEDSAYHAYLNDAKVAMLIEEYPAVARNLYMRGDKTTEWILLTCVEPCGLKSGEWAAVILKGGKVQNPY